jgi:hypothetical protein
MIYEIDYEKINQLLYGNIIIFADNPNILVNSIYKLVHYNLVFPYNAKNLILIYIVNGYFETEKTSTYKQNGLEDITYKDINGIMKTITTSYIMKWTIKGDSFSFYLDNPSLHSLVEI